MSRRRLLLLLLSGAAVSLVVMGYLGWRGGPETKLSQAPTVEPSASSAARPSAGAMTPLSHDTSPKGIRSKELARRLDAAVAALRTAPTSRESRQILRGLRAELEVVPADVAAAAMADFLENPGQNAPTHIGFSVGKGGQLDGHPTLRVALLDWLGQIHPSQAGTMAEQILATPTDPDEWAVCLRNYARAHPESGSREYLRSKTEELIRNPTWREQPSVGFLEAFDVLVHTEATTSAGLLGELAADRTPKGKVLAHAAYLTLDRLTIRQPAAMMEALTAQPELCEARGPMVASLIARADLRDPAQRRLLREYLLDPRRTADELAAFSGVYPNANFTVSRNLLTETRSPTRQEIVAHDAAALETVEVWLADPVFQAVKPHLREMQSRLKTFVQQAAQRTAASP